MDIIYYADNCSCLVSELVRLQTFIYVGIMKSESLLRVTVASMATRPFMSLEYSTR